MSKATEITSSSFHFKKKLNSQALIVGECITETFHTSYSAKPLFLNNEHKFTPKPYKHTGKFLFYDEGVFLFYNSLTYGIFETHETPLLIRKKHQNNNNKVGSFNEISKDDFTISTESIVVFQKSKTNRIEKIHFYIPKDILDELLVI